MLILVPIIIWIMMVFGRRICRGVLGASSDEATPLEISVFGVAVGLGILAYGVMGLGLVSELRPVPIGLLIAFFAIAGWREHVAAFNDMRTSLAATRPTVAGAFIAAAFAFFGLVAFCECLAPPTPLEWDSLSYHLADPKIYLHYGRLLYLPWESHSNFAFTMEMLYSVGLTLGSTSAAKAFHLAMAFIAALAVYLIGTRYMSARAGRWSAMLFVSMPIIFWEAGTAYVDLGAAAFGALALLAVMNGLDDDRSVRWLSLSGILLGLMLSVKATSIVTIVILCLWILIDIVRRRRGIGKALKMSAVVGAVAAIVGCPWYIKSAVYTGNPVYPFAFNVFGGRNWNAELSANYNAAQQQFGVGHLSPGTRMPQSAELIMSPWNLVMYSMPGHLPPPGSKPNPFNDFPSTIVSLSAVMLAGLFLPVFVAPSLAVNVKRMGYFCLASLVVWFFLTQQVRYLIPILAPACLVVIAGLDAALQKKRVSGYALATLLGVSLVGSAIIGVSQLASVGPVVLGTASQQQYLSRKFGSYEAMTFLNALPPNTRVVFYGEPLGFYCNQPYMWGEEGHSTLIPYEKLGSSDALRRYLIARNIHYVLWNVDNFPPGPGPLWANIVHGLFQAPGVRPVYINRRGDIAIFRID